jgi:hypothetical protein
MDGQDLHDPVGAARTEGLPLGKPSSAGNHSGPDPRQVLMPCHSVGHQENPKAGDQGDPHPKQMHRFVPAFGCGHQQALPMPCLVEVGGVADQQDQGAQGRGVAIGRGSFCVGCRSVIGDARPANDPERLKKPS